ncbi:hypothetical protein BDZ89DRAFT_1063418 [Hymenopellis radicata]|nr:hypothetical protein BDZ89DRAFT_1063418 [Hymenopellis radicata]
MSPVETGKYVITNVQYGNVAILEDGNTATPVTADSFDQKNHSRWNVTELSNKRYTIVNFGTATDAYSGDGADEGDIVEGRPSRNQQWVIKETNTSDVYTISTTGSRYYWSLSSGESGTLVTLSAKTDKRSQWTFTKK